MKRLLTILAIASATTACATHKLDPPQGFAQVDHDDYATTMIAPDHVGLNVRVGDNVKGGSLGFWSEDLVNKLGTRGYTLTGQSAVKSKNGVAGTRFDFDYTAPDGAEKFYSAVLFTSDKYRVVLQIAGNADLGPRYLTQLDGIAGETKIRGCKLVDSLCKSPQPRPLKIAPSTSKKTPAKAPGGGATVPAATDA
ncbi:MAG: hypothetical protein KUG77_26145 [Nannocystaceae bacterium]|nr:hypothetical protein [Nannocystaceae bacterium]